ncbi:unnamed protein product [Penicillium crustosum]
MVELISISMREEKRHLIGVRPGKTKSEDSYEGLQKGAIFGVLFRCFFDGPGQTSVADEIPLLMAAASSQAAVPDKIPGIMGDYV